jgi:hypothetical protein
MQAHRSGSWVGFEKTIDLGAAGRRTARREYELESGLTLHQAEMRMHELMDRARFEVQAELYRHFQAELRRLLAQPVPAAEGTRLRGLYANLRQRAAGLEARLVSLRERANRRPPPPPLEQLRDSLLGALVDCLAAIPPLETKRRVVVEVMKQRAARNRLLIGVSEGTLKRWLRAHRTTFEAERTDLLNEAMRRARVHRARVGN